MISPRAESQPYPEDAKKLAVTPRDHSRYIDFLHRQVGELVSKYGPVDVMWWDYSSPRFQGDDAWGATRLIDTIRAKQPGIIMNNRLYRIPEAGFSGMGTHHVTGRLDPRYGDFVTPEQHIPETERPLTPAPASGRGLPHRLPSLRRDRGGSGPCPFSHRS